MKFSQLTVVAAVAALASALPTPTAGGSDLVSRADVVQVRLPPDGYLYVLNLLVT